MENKQRRKQNRYAKNKNETKDQQLVNTKGVFTFDPQLKSYCTDRQHELLTAWESYGSKRAAAKALGINANNFSQAFESVNRKAANTIPEGCQLSGTSTLYDANGNVRLEWVKTGIDKAQQEILFQEAAKTFAEKIAPIKPIKAPKKALDENLMTCFPVAAQRQGEQNKQPCILDRF